MQTPTGVAEVTAGGYVYGPVVTNDQQVHSPPQHVVLNYPNAQYSASPMVVQPSGSSAPSWMEPQLTIPGCPPGLEYLSSIDQLLVHQQVEIFEVLTGYETNNKYAIKNSMGQLVFFAVEDTDCCSRYFCGAARAFNIKILDNFGHEVMHVERKFRCPTLCCCCRCCLQEVSVYAPPGVLIGKVCQTYECCEPHYTIRDAAGSDLLHIEGPCGCCACCFDAEFKLLSLDKATQIGSISKQWSNLAQELYSDADNFGVTFPRDMSVVAKAIVLGAVFLIDFMFFERSE